MKGALGNALMAVGGSGTRLAKSSTRASDWAENPALIEALKKGPSKVIISLNGNGIGGTDELINTLKTYLPKEVPLIWTGAPPPQYRVGDENTWAKYLTTPTGFTKAYYNRIKNNATVASKIAQAKGYNWKFISPFDYIKLSSPKQVAGKQIDAGYNCPGCDGIHLPSHVAKDYVSQISSQLA